MIDIARLPALEPTTLRPHYARFLARGRVLLTGHSHQAWPDCARDAVVRAFDDAALEADDKWGRAFEAADAVRLAVASRTGGEARDVALGGNTHELVARFLSALPLAKKRHLVTTAGEFHTLHRQLRRLAEEGVRVEFVPTAPVATLAARLADAVGPDTAAVMASTVLFATSTRVPGLAEMARVAHSRGAAVLLDAYHAFDVVPYSRDEYGDAPVFIVGGGYKYAQWGEGVCFLSVPPGCELRPVYTGWFADFAHLSDPRTDAPVQYGPGGSARFAGATYDPTSHYRAREVARFFDAHGMTVPRLEALYARQTGLIFELLGAHGWEPVTPRDASARGGFVSIEVANASDVVAAMHAEGVMVDARADYVRLGPAPYLTDEEIARGVESFARAARR